MHRTSMESLRQSLFAAVAILLFTITTAYAQGAGDGSIRGRIVDPQGAALPGVIVTATSPNVGGSFSAVSDAEGNYRLINLPPGTDYTVVAALEGFSRFEQRGLVVRAGLNVGLDVTLQVGNLSETLTVKGETPMLEVFKAEQNVNISGELVRALPLTGRRDWSDVLQLAPGTLSASTDRFGGQVYFLRGSENENHVATIDGADIGSFGQNWPSNFISLSTDALGDVQVKTGGVDASAPTAMGMVINIASPSGTDRYRGTIGTAFTPRSWNGNNTPNGTSPISDSVQLDLSGGGPVQRGRAWFFVAERYVNRKDGISRDDRQLSILQALVPGFESFDNEAKAWISFVNGTVQLSTKHRLSGFFQDDRRTQGQNFQNNGGNFDKGQLGGSAVGARLTSVWGNAITTRFLASYNNKGTNTDASVFDGLGSGPTRNVTASVVPSAGKLQGTGTIAVLDNLASRSLSPASKPTISGDLTYYRPNGFGSHEIQTGFYLQPHLRQKQTTIYSNGGFTTEDVVLRDANNPAAGFIPYHRVYVDTPNLVTSYIGAEDYALYVQDSWRPVSRLTVSVGLRGDYIASRDLLFDVETSSAWNVGPRIGATYGLTNDHRHILRASWGRVYDIPNASYLGSAGSNRAGLRDEYDNNLDGVFETVLTTPGSTAVAANRAIDPDRHQGFIDEWIVGYRTQLPGQLSVDVAYIDRAYKDRPAQVETNGIYDGGVFQGYRDVSFNEINLVTNNRWNWFVYRGFEVTANRRSRDWQLYSTYTLALQHIDGTWQPNDPASFIQPEAFANDAGLGTVRGNTTNSLGGDTRNRMWQRHQVRTGVTWSAPWHLVLSTNVSFQSGTPSGPVTTNIASPDARFGPPTLTLSNGRVVSNPLATTLRFAYADRGTGQVWTPWLNTWNVRVGRSFPLGGATVDASIDVFNLTNNDADQQFVSGGNQLNSPNYGLLTNRQLPRSAQAVVRVAF
jgi:Carboxypeptidase regulatory-like domain/TonB dependent receptor-like, beta-barrel